MLHALILAGGSGTRFWPRSREARPKQLLSLVGERSMLEATVDRLAGLVPKERIVIATSAALEGAIAEQLPQLAPEAIIAEPVKRDTAPGIALAALLIARRDSQATLVVTPSDHVISPIASFQQAVREAVALVDAEPDRIVTFGIKPTYPAESFGYIERGDAIRHPGSAPAAKVKQFREKPKRALAEKYLSQGGFFWNAGIFVWRAQTILEAIKRHQPKLHEHLATIAEAIGTPRYQQVLEREFAAIEPISIDYAVLEHAKNVVVLEAPFAWDDVGSWQAVSRLEQPDEAGNIVRGRHLSLDTSGCVIRTDDEHLVVTVGLRDIIIVHTPDATLVANRHDEEAMRRVTALLKERGWTEYL